MSDLFKLLQEADLVSLEMERAKAAVEVSKEAWEQAKEDFEEAKKSLEKIYFKADNMAIPRQRIRRLIEERTQALVSSGLLESEARASILKGAGTGKKNSKPSGKRKSAGESNTSSGPAAAEFN